MNRAHRAIRAHLDKAHALGIAEVERLARKIMKENPTFKGFCMAMGSASFSREEYEVEDGGRYRLGDYVDANDPRIKELQDFLDMFDRDLHLTGTPLRIDGRWDAPVRTEW